MTTTRKTLAAGVFGLAFALVLACAAGFGATPKAYAADADLQAGGLTVSTADTVTTVPTYGNDSQNTTGAANIRTVYRWGWISGGNNTATNRTSRTLDVTGDGWADKIQVIGTRNSNGSGYLTRVKVLVNGKKAVLYKNTSNKIDRAVVSVVTLANKKPFLWVNLLDGKGNGVQKLYQYKGSKFKLVLANTDLAKKKASNPVITSLEPSGNKVSVSYTLATTATGITKLKYTYAYKSGTLRRSSDTAASLSYATGDKGEFTKNKLTAAGSFDVYSDTALDDVKFTVKSGKKVQPVSVRIKGKNLLYKVKYNGKTGWISCPTIKRQSSKSPTTLFYETYGQVKLKSSVPAYSKTKLLTAQSLQKYNDHALFIARNEILARHGQTFTNAELRNRFTNSSWWSSAKTALSWTEQANVSLIQAIEQNRGSLYAA